MDAKEYLRKVKKMEIMIDHLQSEADELRAAAMKMTSYSNGDGIRASRVSDKMSFVDRCVDKEMEISGLIIDMHELRHKVIQEIHQLRDDKYIQVLYKRYIEYKSLEEISYEMNYNYKYTCRVHGNALSTFEKLILSSDDQKEVD